MASKITNAAEAAENRDESTDGIMLDEVGQAVKKLLLKGKEWGWRLVMVAFAIATYIFISDVDWSQNLGLQFS